MPNSTFDNLLTTTLDKHRASFVDAIFKARPLAYWLKRAGNIEMVSGGDKIIEPLVYAENGTVETYSGNDILSTEDTAILSASSWDWKQLSVAVRMTGIDEAKNSGPEAIMNLLGAKVQVAQESAISRFNTMFHANGAGNGGKDWNGLLNLIEPITGTIGGIDANANTYWRPAFRNTASEAISLARMRTAYNSAAKGNDSPDVILTTQTLYEAYEAILTPNMRYEDKVAGEGGFQSLVFKGTPIVYDEDNAAGNMYFINSKYLKLKGHTNKWFSMTPFVTPNNQDVRTARLLAYGNLVVNNRRMHSVLTGKTA